MTIIIIAAIMIFVAGLGIGFNLAVRAYNDNAEKVMGICYQGKPVKVIRLDFYTSNLVDTYVRWLDMIKKGRPLKDGELTSGVCTQGTVANLPDNDRPEMRGGHPLHGVPERPDVHPVGGGELPIQGVSKERRGDVPPSA